MMERCIACNENNFEKFYETLFQNFPSYLRTDTKYLNIFYQTYNRTIRVQIVICKLKLIKVKTLYYYHWRTKFFILSHRLF